MIVLLYDNKLKLLGRFEQDKSPTISQLNVPNAVLAFDQSTSCTGITVGNNKGHIYGYMRLIKENSKENGEIYIANFREWLLRFIDIDIDIEMLLYEYTFSKQYFNTDVILSQLRGIFKELHKSCQWKFPMESVYQQDWKSCVLSLKDGNRRLSKDNAQDAIMTYLTPNLPYTEEYSDVYDSIGIYYYYTRHFMNQDLSTPIEVTKRLKIQDTIDYVLDYIVDSKLDLSKYDRILKNRGVRYFLFSNDMSPTEHIKRLVSNSNELWVCDVPLINNKYIDIILKGCGKLPGPDERVFLIGYRTKSKVFKKRIL